MGDLTSCDKAHRHLILVGLIISPMTIELPKQKRTDAIASLQRYFDRNMPEPLGDLPAGLLLNFILEEIGPAIYNGAVHDAQARLGQRVTDLDSELYIDEFQYWAKKSKTTPRRSR